MPHSGDLLIRRLHRRALIAAETLSVALIAIAAAYARSASPSGERSERRRDVELVVRVSGDADVC